MVNLKAENQKVTINNAHQEISCDCGFEYLSNEFLLKYWGKS